MPLPLFSRSLSYSLLFRRTAVSKEMESLWGKMASEALPKGLARAAFIVSQYSCVTSTYAERGVNNDDGQAMKDASVRALAAYVDEGVEAQFRMLTGWVKKVEATAAQAAKSRGINFVPGAVGGSSGAASSSGGASGSSSSSSAPVFLPPEGVPVSAEQAETETIVKDFALNWRAGLSGLNDDVNRYVGRDSKAAPAVLMALFQKVAEFHGRFTGAVTRAFPNNTAITRDFVALPTVYAEMRRYARQ